MQENKQYETTQIDIQQKINTAVVAVAGQSYGNVVGVRDVARGDDAGRPVVDEHPVEGSRTQDPIVRQVLSMQQYADEIQAAYAEPQDAEVITRREVISAERASGHSEVQMSPLVARDIFVRHHTEDLEAKAKTVEGWVWSDTVSELALPESEEVSDELTSVFQAQEAIPQEVKVVLSNYEITEADREADDEQADIAAQELLAFIASIGEDYEEDEAMVATFFEGGEKYGQAGAQEPSEQRYTLDRLSEYVTHIVGSEDAGGPAVEGVEVQQQLEAIVDVADKIEALYTEVLQGYNAAEMDLGLVVKSGIAEEALSTRDIFTQFAMDGAENSTNLQLQERLEKLETELYDKVDVLFKNLGLQISEDEKREFVAKILREICEKVAISQSKDTVDERVGTHEVKRSISRWQKATVSFAGRSISQFVGIVATQRTISIS